jgi:hypothetical protein
MRVQNRNGEKNQAKLVGEGFAFLINTAIAPKKDGKKDGFFLSCTALFFQLEKKVCSASKGVVFFYTKTKCILVFPSIFLPPFVKD